MPAEGYDILIVDDEKNIRKTLSMILSSEGYQTEEASTAKEALQKLREKEFDLILLDVRLPDDDGIRLIDDIKTISPSSHIIMISGHANVQNAVEAIKKGAYDFFEKPLDRERVLLSIRHSIERKNLYEELISIKKMKGEDEILGKSEKILEVLQTLNKVAPTNARVFITGESGTGKELAAKYIHQNSRRRRFPFIKVNCAAIPSELIESELFGYEKGAFSGASDTIRVIAATNKDIKALISEGKFREDLFFRINVVSVHMPALRERKEDLPIFVQTFIQDICRENGLVKKEISEEALKKLMEYDWPGNVRELKNVIESLVILSDKEITTDDLPDFIEEKIEHNYSNSLKKTKEDLERRLILDALEKSDWIISRAAKILGLERTTLHKRLKALGITRQNTKE